MQKNTIEVPLKDIEHLGDVADWLEKGINLSINQWANPKNILALKHNLKKLVKDLRKLGIPDAKELEHLIK